MMLLGLVALNQVFALTGRSSPKKCGSRLGDVVRVEFSLRGESARTRQRFSNDICDGGSGTMNETLVRKSGCMLRAVQAHDRKC